jgi:hypothetical protein
VPNEPPPTHDAVRLAFKLSLKEHLASLPPAEDLLSAVDEMGDRLHRILQSAPDSSTGTTDGLRHRAVLAAQLHAAVEELKAEIRRPQKEIE